MHILHGKKIEQPIEKLSESFLDLSLNWADVGELKNGVQQSHVAFNVTLHLTTWYKRRLVNYFYSIDRYWLLSIES